MRIGIGQQILDVQQRYPLLVAGLLFLFGIYFGYTIPLMNGRLLGAGVALCALMLLVRRRTGQARGFQVADVVVLALASVLLGAGRAAWDREGREHEGALLTAVKGKTTCSLVCRVGPDVAAKPFTGKSVRYSFQGLTPVVQTLKGDHVVRYLPVTVNWFASAADKELAPKAGEVWRFRGSLSLTQARRSQLAVLTLNTGKNEKRSRRCGAAEEGVWPLRLAAFRRDATRRLALGIEDWGIIPGLTETLEYIQGWNDCRQAMLAA